MAALQPALPLDSCSLAALMTRPVKGLTWVWRHHEPLKSLDSFSERTFVKQGLCVYAYMSRLVCVNRARRLSLRPQHYKRLLVQQ